MFIAALVIGLFMVLFCIVVVIVANSDIKDAEKRCEEYVHERDLEIAQKDYLIAKLKRDATCKDCRFKRCKHKNTDRCDVFRVDELAESAEQFMKNIPEGE